MKPEYDAGKNLKEQMESAVTLYDSEMSLQAIGEELGLNPIKVRKLLITAGVYESEVAEKVQAAFQEYCETQDYKTSILSTANTLKLSKASVTSYLPYKKGVYFPSTAEKEKISVGAELLFVTLPTSNSPKIIQIKRRYSIIHSDEYYVRLYYPVPSVIITKSLITKEAGTSPSKVWFPASHTHHRHAYVSARL